MDFGARKPAGAAPAPAGDLVKNTTTAGFTKDVIEASKQALVLVDFWAAWCEPCKQLAPVLEKVVRSYGGKVRLVKLDIVAHPTIPGQLRVQNLPTVYAFRHGRGLDGFMGMQTEAQIRAFIDRLLGEEGRDAIADALATAEQAAAAGDLQRAAEVYALILQEDKQNAVALAGLARCYLQSGDLGRTEQTLALIPPDKRDAAPVAGVRAAVDLAKRAGGASDTAGLEAALARNPADHQARIDLALALAARGDKAKALDHLLDAVKRDRNWNEQAARKQLVQLFDAWGPKDPHTIEGRRRLSSLLFS
jgi:putative thioredoxin